MDIEEAESRVDAGCRDYFGNVLVVVPGEENGLGEYVVGGGRDTGADEEDTWALDCGGGHGVVSLRCRS